MTMEGKLKSILDSVQQNASCHQKYLKNVEKYYSKVPLEDFVEDFFKYLRHIFHNDIIVRNAYVERTLEFLAKFVSLVTKPNADETQSTLDDDSTSHPFLSRIIEETLRFHDLVYEQTRYYSCRFITLILQHISAETHLDNFICDCIQESMLERILDPKTPIRIQAIMALIRLQEPSNPECPVIKAYLSLLSDGNPQIRKEVVKRIAPNSITISKISERIRDVDNHVRVAAFLRCAEIGPRLFKIITRQQILQCGFKDDKKDVKTVFLESLLPKWLSAYNDNYLDFLSSLKLDADENDIINTEEICKQVMEVLFNIAPMQDIINTLPVNDEKVIPVTSLNIEVVTYWSALAKFLRNSEDLEGFLDQILPELTPFCNYIQSIIDFKMSNKMEEWEFLEYQYILYNIFDMAEEYDLSDEVGRRTFHKLIMSVLQNQKLQFKMAKKLISIADKLFSNVDTLTHDICQIISDIREPLVDKPLPHYEVTNRNFQVAELKVKLNILEGEMEDALESEDFEKASFIKNELAQCRKRLEEVEGPSQVVKVRVAKDDPEIICQCLDILSALMELPSVSVISPSLATCRTEFVLPLLTSSIVEINWRVLKCLALYCVLDKGIAEEHVKVLCIPIVTYRAIPNYNKFALMESVASICDLMRIYGPKLFGGEEDSNSTTAQHNTTKRRLYRNDAVEDITNMDHNRMNVEFIIEILLDMLDDENEDIRETAVTAISKLVLNEFPVNSSLMCRIILKWFNPVEKAVDKTQQKLGSLISHYTMSIKGAREVIEKAVVPIITSLASAPRTSPLADVDIDNVLHFLAAITNSSDTADIVHIHTNLAHTICHKLTSKPKDPFVPYLTKMLLYLEIPPSKAVAIKELITQVDLLLEDEEIDMDKGPKRHLKKFCDKLKDIINNATITEQSTQDMENSKDQTNQRGGEVVPENSRLTEATNRTERLSLQDKSTNFDQSSNENSRGNNTETNNRIDDVGHQPEVVSEENNIESHSSSGTESRQCKRLKVLFDDEDDSRKRNDMKNVNDPNDGSQPEVVSEENKIESDSSSGTELRQCKRLKVLLDVNSVNVIIPKPVQNVNEDDSRKRNSLNNVSNKTPPSQVQSNRNLRSGKKVKVISVVTINAENNINNNTIDKRREVKKTANIIEENKNANNKHQTSKRTRNGRQIANNIDNERGNARHSLRGTRSKKVTSDADTDTTITDVEEDGLVTLKRSKRLSKRAEAQKENLKNNCNPKVTEVQINHSKNSTKETNLETLSMSLTNNLSSNEDSVPSTNGVKRKKSRGKMSLSTTSEETVLHTILEMSQQISILESSNTTIESQSGSSGKKSSSDLSNRSKTVISETSESESSASPVLRRSVRKIRKKNK